MIDSFSCPSHESASVDPLEKKAAGTSAYFSVSR